MNPPFGLYVHIPFCESLCYYCACNKIITRHHERSREYLHYLMREIALHAERLGPGLKVTQLHLGGGTPTFFTDDELRELLDALHRSFHLRPGGEYSIEVDPRTGKKVRDWGSIGHKKVFGLSFWGGKLYGFDEAGALFEVAFDTNRIVTTPIPMPQRPGDLSFWGAGSSTSAPLVVDPQ